MNVSVQAPTTEKFLLECSPEFGSGNIGKVTVVTRALYGIKSSARDFKNHFREYMVKKILSNLHQLFPPKSYLGGKLCKLELLTGIVVWIISTN